MNQHGLIFKCSNPRQIFKVIHKEDIEVVKEENNKLVKWVKDEHLKFIEGKNAYYLHKDIKSLERIGI